MLFLISEVERGVYGVLTIPIKLHDYQSKKNAAT